MLRPTESSKILETLYAKIKTMWIGIPEEAATMDSEGLRCYLHGYNRAYHDILDIIEEVKDENS